MRRFMLKSCAVLVFAFGVTVAGAQTNVSSVSTGEVVVTATRVPRLESEVPAAVTVIGESDIRNSPAQNADDLLRSVSGVSILRSYGMGQGIPSQINIRGVPGTQRTLLLVDGLPLNEAISGFLGINEVPMEAVRQIEVVRGPFSALYGTDAFGGVVALLTRDPGPATRVETAVSAGNEGYLRYLLQSSGTLDGIGYSVCADTRTIDNYTGRDAIQGQRLDLATGAMVDTAIVPENYGYSDTRILAKLVLPVGHESDLMFQVQYYDGELGYGQTDLTPLFPVPVDNEADTSTLRLGGVLTSALTTSLKGSLSAFVRRQERQTEGLNFSEMMGVIPLYVPSTQRTVSDDWQTDGRLDWTFSSRNTVVAGVEFHRIEGDFSPVRNSLTDQALPWSESREASVNNGAVYVQDEAKLMDRLNLTTGIRLDMNSEFGDVVSPRAGALYQVTDATAVRASVGRAYRAPSLLELYQPRQSFGNFLFESNPDLDPEYIVAGDAGVEHRFSGSVRGHVEGFYNDMSDLISSYPVGGVFTFINVDEAWSAGSEVGLEWDVIDRLSLFVNYTYEQSENETTGTDLPYVAEHQVGGGLRGTLPCGRWSNQFSILESYVGERGAPDVNTGLWTTFDGYWRTDASWRSTFGDRAWIGASAQNLLDATYEESQVLSPAPGRLWSVEVGVRF